MLGFVAGGVSPGDSRQRMPMEGSVAEPRAGHRPGEQAGVGAAPTRDLGCAQRPLGKDKMLFEKAGS